VLGSPVTLAATTLCSRDLAAATPCSSPAGLTLCVGSQIERHHLPVLHPRLKLGMATVQTRWV
jgi:hypothetical protein